MALGRFLRDQLAGGRRAGERNMLDAMMLRERVARFRAEAGDDIDGAFGKANRGRQFSNA